MYAEESQQEEIKTEYSTESRDIRRLIGMKLSDAPSGGAIVRRVKTNKPAFNAGFSEGDVIISVNNSFVRTADDVYQELERSRGVVYFEVIKSGTGRSTYLEIDLDKCSDHNGGGYPGSGQPGYPGGGQPGYPGYPGGGQPGYPGGTARLPR